MALIPANKIRTEMHKLMLKHMTQKTINVDPRVGKIYHMKSNQGERDLWTREHGWLWTYTGRDETKPPALKMQMPVFKAIATGHEEWLPWDWLEEADNGAA